MPRSVLHLVGSPESEPFAELSRLYARDALTELHDPARFTPHVAHVSPDGAWRLPADLSSHALASAPTLSAAEGIARIVALAPDVVLPQLFCRAGMTHYRALLDVLGLRYLGNPPEAMALTADKARARAVVAAAGVRVPEGELLRRGERPSLAPPVVVKPADADNSVGVSLVREAGEYDAALRGAFAHTDAVLVERYVPLGREVRCGVLVRGGELVGLPLEEYRVDDVRGPADKLTRDADGELRLVAKGAERAWILAEDDSLTPAVWALARRAHVALGCRHYSLFDVRVDPAGEPWFLEASLYCSFARQSVLCAMAQAAGLSPLELFTTVLEESDGV